MTQQQRWDMVTNRLNIHTEVFDEILEQEERLRERKNRYPIGSRAWHEVWDQLDKVLRRKKSYENAVEQNRTNNWCKDKHRW